MKRILFLGMLITQSVMGYTQEAPSAEVERVLSQAKGNSAEFKIAIERLQHDTDSLKLKALYFLLVNTDIHTTETYYWANTNNTSIEFNELRYASFDESLQAFDSLKTKVGAVHPVPQKFRDIDSLKADFLVDNINAAFRAWRNGNYKDCSFEVFCEYILPYRISVEPIQDWRVVYAKQFAFIQSQHIDTSLRRFINDVNKWFTCTYNLEKRSDPLPRLGSRQLLLRKKGLCEDIADLSVFALRSQGIPCSVDEVPFWATSIGGHTLNVAFTTNNKPVPFDVLLKSDSLNQFIREPGKVIRTTFSKQPTLASFEASQNIPLGFLRRVDYVDVTEQYWPTTSISYTLPTYYNRPSVTYACVFNGLTWQPIWWGKNMGDSVRFENMSKGAAYLPMYYIQGKLTAAGYPIVAGYNHTEVLHPDKSAVRSITLQEQSSYLRFKPFVKYTLFYWDYGWKKIADQTPDENTTEMTFSNVPQHALYLLLPQNSNHKERPFSILDDRTRLWW